MQGVRNSSYAGAQLKTTLSRQSSRSMQQWQMTKGDVTYPRYRRKGCLLLDKHEIQILTSSPGHVHS